MRGKSKVQAMPRKKSARPGTASQGNPGQAGPKGALDEKPARRGAPSSGPRGAEGNNTRRDYVGGPRKK